MKKYLFVPLTFFIFTQIINSQQYQFEQITPPPPSPQIELNFCGTNYGNMDFADIDRDGDQDLLITGFSYQGFPITYLYINEGDGNFTKATNTPFEGVSNSSVKFVDVDNDNDMDIFITGRVYNQRLITKIYRNNGNGEFTELTGNSFTKYFGASFAFADIDNDDDVDLLISGRDDLNSTHSSTKLYLNDGTGIFTENTNTHFPTTINYSNIAFADIDNDNDVDLLMIGFNFTKLYKNDGTGNFIETNSSVFVRGSYRKIKFADIDNDNDNDVLIDHFIYKNDGNGNFSEVPHLPFIELQNFVVADFDNDNDVDVFSVGETSMGYCTKLYTNDGTGNFTEVTGTPFVNVVRSTIGVADVNGDQKLDILVLGNNPKIFQPLTTTLYINKGSNDFVKIKTSPIERVTYSKSIFEDIDYDGDLDVIINGTFDDENSIKIYLNDGTGFFSESPNLSFLNLNITAFDIGDINGDNYIDLVLVVDEGWNETSVKLFLNDGQGNFQENTSSDFGTNNLPSVYLADIDGDNDKDIFIGKFNPIRYVFYKNDGHGNFSLGSNALSVPAILEPFAFADIDGDSDLDLLASWGETLIMGYTKLYKNDGHGNFSVVTGTSFNSALLGSIDFADIDSDNDLDVLITGISYSRYTSKLYENDGHGNFTPINTPIPGLIMSNAAFVDIDGDNDLDLLVSGSDHHTDIFEHGYTQLFINNNGVFSQTPQDLFIGVYNGDIATGDIDNDGDEDVLVTGENDCRGVVSYLYRNEITLSPQNNNIPSVTTFPNPANHVINLNPQGKSINKIFLFDETGKMVPFQFDSEHLQLKVNLHNGIYFVKLELDDKILTKKIIIKQ